MRALLADAAARLGGDDARGEVELLLAHVLGRTRAWLFAWPEHEASAEQAGAFERLVEARRGGAPVAYLLGRRGFWSFDLAVSPAVLIPRPETELLVELALERIPSGEDCALADLGTGSGAIALAIALRPLLVAPCLIGARLSRGENAFVLLAGLKGAVPLLLGSLMQSAPVPRR